MEFLRFSMMVLICACVSGIACADTDDEKAEHDTAKAVLAKAKIDIVKALETAQVGNPTGKPFYASTASEDNLLLFEVQLLVDGSVIEVTINAVTGGVEMAEPGEEDDDFEESKKVLAESKTSFAQAIATAQGKVEDGKPFEVWTDIEDGKSIIGVELLAGDRVKSVEIDALTGKVVKVEEDED
jgi:uncharacterized membrane protein YkoI